MKSEDRLPMLYCLNIASNDRSFKLDNSYSQINPLFDQTQQRLP